MSAPQISVIMPVFDAAAFVRESVASVLAQTFRDFELIIIDDASTDESMQIIRGIDDERIRVFQHPENLGAAKTKNTGIKHARGEFVAFLDADDIALPQRFAEQINFFVRHPATSILASQVTVIDARGAPADGESVRPRLPDEIAATLLFENCIAQSSVMLRTGVLPPGPFHNDYILAEDYELWARLSPGAHFAIIQRPLVKYRVHPASASARNAAAMRESVRSIHTALLARYGLTPAPLQLDLHGQFACWPVAATRELVAQAEEWLMVLQKANAAARIHPQDVLDRMIARRWYSVCLDSWQLGFWAWRAWWRSPLRRLATVSPLQHLQLLRRVAPVSLKSRAGFR